MYIHKGASMSTLAVEAIKRLVPKTQRTLITQEFVDKLEGSIKDPLIAEAFKDNFITYLSVLQTGKYKMNDYINAIKYVSFKLLNYSNIDAYAATFPERYQRLKEEGQEQIDAYCSMYNKTKLVTQIYEQTIVPSYVLNAPLYQNTLVELARMIQDPSVRGMTKVKACEVLLQHTKAPEIIKSELTIGIDQQSTIADLREVVEGLAEIQRKQIETGHRSVKEIAESRIIDVSPENEDEES